MMEIKAHPKEKKDMFCQESYKIQMVTPGFLGGADQSGEWRTPPFKALIRTWWRIVWWNKAKNPTIQQMHLEEGRLFGSSSGNINLRSSVRISLAKWKSGSLDGAGFNRLTFGTVTHRELPKPIDPALYLGYGPVNYNKEVKRATMSREMALAPGDANSLTFIYPSEFKNQMGETLKLVAHFGTIGSRSRNAWGSFLLWPVDSGKPLLGDHTFFDPKNNGERNWLEPYAKDLKSALEQDWCHCIGKDEKGLLLWCTEMENTWEKVLEILAVVKIAFRRQFHFKGAKNPPHKNDICERHLLAYPVTHHEFWPWKSGRSANQIFFKVLPDRGGFRGLVFHLPHRLPAPLANSLGGHTKQNLLQTELGVWERVHQELDKKLTRLP